MQRRNALRLYNKQYIVSLLDDMKKVLFDAIDPNCPANLKDGGYILSSFK